MGEKSNFRPYTDSLQWALGLGWDRGWKDENMDKVPHGDGPYVGAKKMGRSSVTHLPSRIQPPPHSTYRQRKLCSTVFWAVMGSLRGKGV